MTVWFRTPAPLRVAAVFAAWFIYGAVVSNLLTLHDNDRVAPLVWGVCLAGAGIVMAVDAGVHRRFCSAEDLRAYVSALQDGELPADADPAVWWRRTSHSRVAAGLASTLLLPLLAFGWIAATYSNTAFHQLPQWAFAAAAIVTFGASCRRLGQIKNLEAEIKRRKAIAVRFTTRDRLQGQTELSLWARILSYTAACVVPAGVTLTLADLEVIVYGPDRGAHLLWIVMAAAAVGITATIVVVQDPSLRVTTSTVDEIRSYDRAFRTAELPTDIDVPRWRQWVRARRRADFALLLWAGFYLGVAGWSIASHPSGYRWVVAMLLLAAAGWQLHCFRIRRTRAELMSEKLDRKSAQLNL